MGVDKLSDKQAEILAVISRFGGEAHTRRLTQATNYSNAQIWNYIQTLKREGYVEKIGTVDVKAPRPANNYRITEEGQQVADELDSVATDETEMSEEEKERIEELEQTVARHDRELKRVRKRLSEDEEEIGKNAEAISYIKKKLGLNGE